jgi:hypothetical protein
LIDLVVYNVVVRVIDFGVQRVLKVDTVGTRIVVESEISDVREIRQRICSPAIRGFGLISQALHSPT